MIESIGISLISTLISFLFETNILRHNTSIEIEGAPYWYEKIDDRDRLYISSYLDKNYEHLDEAKDKVVSKMTSIIEEAYKLSSNKITTLNRSEKELKLIYSMQKDTNLKTFVKTHINYQNIKYDKNINRIFVRGYITNKQLKQYQEKRLSNIKIKLLDYQYEDMMKELDEK